jgi:7,8-dihydropterin-6-yl-methyl-4-(beta-D-ribofuranosyl)aminobenzene 5'-phosphate synthase
MHYRNNKVPEVLRLLQENKQMKITVLTDNSVRCGTTLTAEHGFSLLLETNGRKILFDTGQSGRFLDNARIIGAPVEAIDTVILSHGHYDHTGGLAALSGYLSECGTKTPDYFFHPAAACRRKRIRNGNILINDPGEILNGCPTAHPTTEAVKITDSLWLLSGIPSTVPFEKRRAGDEIEQKGTWVPDMVPDDSALVWEGSQGLVIIAGCAHAGVCSTIEAAITTTGEERIADLIGGLHLVSASKSRIHATREYLEGCHLQEIHPCHCTGFEATVAFTKTLPVKDCRVGLTANFETQATQY